MQPNRGSDRPSPLTYSIGYKQLTGTDTKDDYTGNTCRRRGLLGVILESPHNKMGNGCLKSHGQKILQQNYEYRKSNSREYTGWSINTLSPFHRIEPLVADAPKLANCQFDFQIIFCVDKTILSIGSRNQNTKFRLCTERILNMTPRCLQNP